MYRDSGVNIFAYMIGISVAIIVVYIAWLVIDQPLSYTAHVDQVNPPGLLGPSTVITQYSGGSKYSPTTWTINHVLPVTVGEEVRVWVSFLGQGSVVKVASNTQVLCDGNC